MQFSSYLSHLVDHMFSLYFDYISRFGFEGWIWVLIASIPDLCILFTSLDSNYRPVYSYAFCVVSTFFGVQITHYESL